MDLVDFHHDDADYVDRLRVSYQNATPFPHVVMHDVLRPTSDEIVGAFPDLRWDGWNARQHSYAREKRFCRDIERMPDLLRRLIYELETPTVLRFLSSITGIERLLPDPYLEGGGLHCSPPGGQLVPHTDFHLYEALDLYRQVNLLLYLNPMWKPGDGGELQLFSKGGQDPVVSVEPTFGTCVIFGTDHLSVHGVSPVTEHADARRSIALYYYTSTENEKFSGDDITYWQGHDVTSLSKAERAELLLSRGLVRTARVFHRLGHRSNPIYRNAAKRRQGKRTGVIDQS